MVSIPTEEKLVEEFVDKTPSGTSAAVLALASHRAGSHPTGSRTVEPPALRAPMRVSHRAGVRIRRAREGHPVHDTPDEPRTDPGRGDRLHPLLS